MTVSFPRKFSKIHLKMCRKCDGIKNKICKMSMIHLEQFSRNFKAKSAKCLQNIQLMLLSHFFFTFKSIWRNILRILIKMKDKLQLSNLINTN